VNAASRRVQRTYLLLLLLHTLAGSFIWGINTLFLLDAGLTNTEAFAANAFFTAGLVLFEIPTGVVADTRGRRRSYLLGTLTLAAATLLYYLMWLVSAPFWAWAVTSVFLGLGFTFFSGAVEAWLVDALTFRGYFREGGKLESVMARGEIVEGVAMLAGSVAGGVLAQATNLGIPYLVRALALVCSFLVAFRAMRDLGFTPHRDKRALDAVRLLLRATVEKGLRDPPVRWVMLAAPFTGGVMIYAFYAMQPYLLELYENERAYAVAGLAAAIVAGAQIAGGLLVPHAGRLFARRTSVLLLGTSLSALVLAVAGLLPRFWVVIVMLMLWGLMFAALAPVRQAYLNEQIGSQQRATVLSFDSLLSSGGGVVIQPILGRAADVWGYPASYVVSGVLQALSIPFLWAARRQRASADDMHGPSVLESADTGKTGGVP
jgi:MFS family permease